MSYLEHQVKHVPQGLRKLLFLNWPLILLIIAAASAGFLMLYSVAGGDLDRWARPQMEKFVVGLWAMILIGVTPVYFWRNVAGLAYASALIMLVLVEFIGVEGKGAVRWLDLRFMQLQPSELMKITLVMALAAYYDWLPLDRTSKPVWLVPPLLMILVPVALVLRQPDLGTSILLVAGGGTMLFLAGVHWVYFASIIGAGVAAIVAVFESRGTAWQLLADYQYRRIDTYLDPGADPLGAGYNITQAKIALGSGGLSGKGFMQGTQSRLNFLPEKQTDFIFNTLAEEFGFVGGMTLLLLYGLIIFFCVVSALQQTNRFAMLLTLGVAVTFFFYFAVNMSMVMGLAPVVGVPLPLVSYGGSAMLVLLFAFGLVQSAHVHRPRSGFR